MATLTKAILVQQLIEQVGLDNEQSLAIVERFFEEIMQALERKEVVKLVGLGKFLVCQKAKRPGRNPKTGEPVDITPRQVIRFKVSNRLKQQLQE